MLDQEMGASNLALGRRKCSRCDALGAVVGRHVVLQPLGVGACRGLPSRVFGLGVEVIGQILRVGAAHLPSLGETSLGG